MKHGNRLMFVHNQPFVALLQSWLLHLEVKSVILGDFQVFSHCFWTVAVEKAWLLQCNTPQEWIRQLWRGRPLVFRPAIRAAASCHSSSEQETIWIKISLESFGPHWDFKLKPSLCLCTIKPQIPYTEWLFCFNFAKLAENTQTWTSEVLFNIWFT